MYHMYVYVYMAGGASADCPCATSGGSFKSTLTAKFIYILLLALKQPSLLHKQ